MGKSHFSIKFCTIALLLIVYADVESIRTDHEPVLTKRKFFLEEENMKTPMHKVQMTQRGYIQVKFMSSLRFNHFLYFQKLIIKKEFVSCFKIDKFLIK